MYFLTPDGSVVDGDGRVFYFSIERFRSTVCNGRSCIVCGRTPEDTGFNEEHVIPDWVLRRFSLFDQRIVLPNSSSIPYRQMRMPCCKSCNGLYGRELEQPISRLLSKKYDVLIDEISEVEARRIISWLALIYVKLHLNDQRLRMDITDPQRGSIGQMHTWEFLHHSHCLARAPFTQEIFESDIASLVILPASTEQGWPRFDFVSMSLPRTMLFRIEDVALLVVLGDGGIARNIFETSLSKLEGPLSPIQVREVVANLAFISLSLDELPEIKTEFDFDRGLSRMLVRRPRAITPSFDKTLYGQALHQCCFPIAQAMQLPNLSDLEQQLLSGECSFLLDRDGRFIQHEAGK